MLSYWLFFFVISFFAILSKRRVPLTLDGRYNSSLSILWWIMILFLTFFIGLRHYVGGDWTNYIRHLQRLNPNDVLGSLNILQDPGYNLLNYASLELGWGIYGVNIFCGFIFSLGLAFFCRHLPRPFLALAVAFPYMVIVVAMGYTRQGVALGIAMIGLVFLSREKRFRFVILILIAATIHKAAFLLMPIAALASTKNRKVVFFSFAVIIAYVYFVFLSAAYEKLIFNYIEAQYRSQGAFIRLTMNAIPSAIFLIWNHRFNLPDSDRVLWKIFAYISLLLMAMLFLTDASTALDRIGLYMIPIQLVVFAYLPEAFGSRGGSINQWIVLIIIGYYFSVMFVWLNFSSHAALWLPYKNILFNAV